MMTAPAAPGARVAPTPRTISNGAPIATNSTNNTSTSALPAPIPGVVTAFVSGVDRPLGHALSRILAATVAGSKLPPAEGTGAEEEEEAGAKAPDGTLPPQPYRVLGTLSTDRAPVANWMGELTGPLPSTLSKHAAALEGIGHVELPGELVETGVKKRDVARKEAVMRFAVTGRVGKWVADVVSVSE
jgi:hypothetical protein